MGIGMGLLALTKTAFLSIGIGFILLLAFIERRKLIYGTDTRSPWQLRRSYALLVLAFLATVSPWIARNAINYGRPEMIAGRGEGILGVRMMLAELPSLGVLYASSSAAADGRSAGLGLYACGSRTGRGARHLSDPPQAQWLTFDSKRKAEGYEGTTEQWLRRKAILSAVNQPLEYLTSVGLSAYRGMWFMQPFGLAQRLDPMVFYALNALSFLCLRASAPEEGDYFKADWLKPYDTRPARETLRVYGGSDYAVTADGGDYTVHIVVGIDPDGRMYLLDLWRKQTASDEWIEAFCNLLTDWKPVGWAEEKGQISAGVGLHSTKGSGSDKLIAIANLPYPR